MSRQKNRGGWPRLSSERRRLLDAVDRAALLVALGLDLEPELRLEAAGHGAAHRVRLPAEPLGRLADADALGRPHRLDEEGLLRLLAWRRLGSLGLRRLGGLGLRRPL